MVDKDQEARKKKAKKGENSSFMGYVRDVPT
jgi:hypothetical protein